MTLILFHVLFCTGSRSGPLPEPRDYLMSFGISSSVNHPDCAIIIIGVGRNEVTEFENFFLYCRCHEKRWAKLPLRGQFLIGVAGVICEGKLYAHDNIGNVIIFDVPSLLEGRINMTTSLTLKIPMYPRTDRTDLYLVESCGHVYLVRIKCYGMAPATYIDIHRVDVTANSWLRVDTIGDHAFFPRQPVVMHQFEQQM